MEFTRTTTGFGASWKSGRRLVAEIYKSGKVIVFEPEYGAELAKLDAKTHTLTNSHSGKINWVGHLDEKGLESFAKVLEGMDLIHTKAVIKKAAAKKATSVTTANTKANTATADTTKQATTKRANTGKKSAQTKKGK